MRPSRILIIDDNEGDRFLLKEEIVETGWNADILEAASGRQAVDVLRLRTHTKAEPDLILVDYILAGETCIDVIPNIRALNGYGSIPIIVIATTKPPEKDRQQIYTFGVLKILVKAADYHSLLKIVKTLRVILTKSGAISNGGSWISDEDLALLGEG